MTDAQSRMGIGQTFSASPTWRNFAMRLQVLAILLVFGTGCAASSRVERMRILDLETHRELSRIDEQGQIIVPGVGPAGEVRGLQVSLPAVPDFSASTETYAPSKNWLGNRYVTRFRNQLLISDDGQIRLLPPGGGLADNPGPILASPPFARVEGLGRAPSPEQRARFLGMFDAMTLQLQTIPLPQFSAAAKQLDRCLTEQRSLCERATWHSTRWNDEQTPPGLAAAFDRLLKALSAHDADAVEPMLCKSPRWTRDRREWLFSPSGLSLLERGREVEPGITWKGDAIFLLPEAVNDDTSGVFFWRRVKSADPRVAEWCLDK